MNDTITTTRENPMEHYSGMVLVHLLTPTSRQQFHQPRILHFQFLDDKCVNTHYKITQRTKDQRKWYLQKKKKNIYNPTLPQLSCVNSRAMTAMRRWDPCWGCQPWMGQKWMVWDQSFPQSTKYKHFFSKITLEVIFFFI